jgi:pimeloyl-ACP methyl ester carboxylesterase
MSLLPVPGADLYYDTVGGGPLLVMMSGASGTAESFRRAADQLARSYTVAIYDRRGFSRSRLDGPQDFEHRLDNDADDLRQLAEHLSDEPVTIVGVSTGATPGTQVGAQRAGTVGEPGLARLQPSNHSHRACVTGGEQCNSIRCYAWTDTLTVSKLAS